MKTSKSPSSHKSSSGRTASSTGARGAAKKTAAKAKVTVKSVKKTVKKAVQRVAKKAVPPKDDRTRVHDLLAGFSTVMLVTGEGDKLSARPMSVAKLDADSTLTFITDLKTAKVDEARKDGVGHVIAQGKMVFLSVRGRVEVVRDRARIEAVWTAAAKVYFPEGKDDPNLCLVVLHPDEAEIWDLSGAKGVKYLFEAARALFSGERPKHDASGDTHDVVALTPDPTHN